MFPPAERLSGGGSGVVFQARLGFDDVDHTTGNGGSARLSGCSAAPWFGHGNNCLQDAGGESESYSFAPVVSCFAYSNKCLQDAVLALLGDIGLRSRAHCFFDAICGNDAGSCAMGHRVERCNFEAVLAFLVASGVWIWVLDDLSQRFAFFW